MLRWINKNQKNYFDKLSILFEVAANFKGAYNSKRFVRNNVFMGIYQ